MVFTKLMSAKHPDVDREYYVDATDLLQAGVTISSATVTCSDPAITIGTVTVQTPGLTVVKAMVSGGVNETQYDVVYTLTLSNSEVEVAVLEIPVYNKA